MKADEEKDLGIIIKKQVVPQETYRQDYKRDPQAFNIHQRGIHL